MRTPTAAFGLTLPEHQAATKILIIEDHNEARKMLTLALRKLGFDVTGAASAAAGLLAVREHKPAVVVLDIGLSDGQNGLLVCEKIKGSKEGTAPYVIITSAHEDKEIVAEAQRLGANAYLVKPFRLSRLLEIVAGAPHAGQRYIVEMQAA